MAEEKKNAETREKIERAAAEIEENGFNGGGCSGETMLTAYAVLKAAAKMLSE